MLCESPKNVRFSLLILAILTSLPAYPVERCEWLFQKRFIFGPEFSFTNEEITREGIQKPMEFRFEQSPIRYAQWKKLITKIKLECVKTLECRFQMGEDKHGPALYIIFKDGYWLSIGGDVGVIEVNARPHTPSDSAKQKARVENFIFKTAERIGLKPHLTNGGGHIHISREAFLEDAQLLRNFFVDYQNRPEISYGVFGRNLKNAPPLAAHVNSQRERLEKILREFDAPTTNKPMSMDSLISRIEREVYTSSTESSFGGPEYYQAVNMTRMGREKGKATLELRAFDPQRDYNVYILELRLLEAWIMRLREIHEPIPYLKKDKVKFTPQETVDAFYDLTQFLGLNFEEFRPILRPKLQEITPSQSQVQIPYAETEIIM